MTAAAPSPNPRRRPESGAVVFGHRSIARPCRRRTTRRASARRRGSRGNRTARARVRMVGTAAFLRAVAAYGFVEIQRRLVHRAIGAAAIQQRCRRPPISLVGREQRCLAELGDIGEDRHLHRLLELAVLVERVDRFRERSCRRRLRRRQLRARLPAATFDGDHRHARRSRNRIAARIDGGLSTCN